MVQLIRIHEIEVGKRYSLDKIDFICTDVGYTSDTKISGCRYFKGDVISGGKIYQEFGASTKIQLLRYD